MAINYIKNKKNGNKNELYKAKKWTDKQTMEVANKIQKEKIRYSQLPEGDTVLCSCTKKNSINITQIYIKEVTSH